MALRPNSSPASCSPFTFDTVCISGFPIGLHLDDIRDFFYSKEGPCWCFPLPDYHYVRWIYIRFLSPLIAQRVVLRYNNIDLGGFRLQVFPAPNGVTGITSLACYTTTSGNISQIQQATSFRTPDKLEEHYMGQVLVQPCQQDYYTNRRYGVSGVTSSHIFHDGDHFCTSKKPCLKRPYTCLSDKHSPMQQKSVSFEDRATTVRDDRKISLNETEKPIEKGEKSDIDLKTEHVSSVGSEGFETSPSVEKEVSLVQGPYGHSTVVDNLSCDFDLVSREWPCLLNQSDASFVEEKAEASAAGIISGLVEDLRVNGERGVNEQQEGMEVSCENPTQSKAASAKTGESPPKSLGVLETERSCDSPDRINEISEKIHPGGIHEISEKTCTCESLAGIYKMSDRSSESPARIQGLMSGGNCESLAKAGGMSGKNCESPGRIHGMSGANGKSPARVLGMFEENCESLASKKTCESSAEIHEKTEKGYESPAVTHCKWAKANKNPTGALEMTEVTSGNVLRLQEVSKETFKSPATDVEKSPEGKQRLEGNFWQRVGANEKSKEKLVVVPAAETEKSKRKRRRRKVRKNKRKKLKRRIEKGEEGLKALASSDSAKVAHSRDLDREIFFKISNMKKQEIEQEYDRECSVLLGVVKTLIRKDPSLNDRLRDVVQDCLTELRDKLLKKLETAMDGVLLNWERS